MDTLVEYLISLSNSLLNSQGLCNVLFLDLSLSLGLSEECKVSTPAFTDALRLYRQSKGHYGTWDLMCGDQAQVSEGHSCLEHLTAVIIKRPSYKKGCFAYKMHRSSDGIDFKLLSNGPQIHSLTHGNKNGGEIRVTLKKNLRERRKEQITQCLSLCTSVFLGSFGLSFFCMSSIEALCV